MTVKHHENLDENDIDRVVHFAAESHVDRSIRNPEVFVKTNVLGTLVMLNAAKILHGALDGTFRLDKKFLCMFLQMKCMVPLRKMAVSMRQPI